MGATATFARSESRRADPASGDSGFRHAIHHSVCENKGVFLGTPRVGMRLQQVDLLQARRGKQGVGERNSICATKIGLTLYPGAQISQLK
jgi:hypothetical protein